MKTLIALLLLTLLCLPACQQIPAAQIADDGKPYKIMCVGDSIVYGDGQGFPMALEKKFHTRILNAGLCSDTSAGTLKRIRALMAYPPAMLIVQVGINDKFYAHKGIWQKYNSTLAHFCDFSSYKLCDYQENINEIYELCQKNNVRLILTTISSNPMQPRLRFYNDILKNYGAIEINLQPQDFIDSVHLSEQGYEDFAEQIYSKIHQQEKK